MKVREQRRRRVEAGRILARGKGEKRGWKKRERERAWHPKDGKPENGETIQSAADAANCPLIIRSRGEWRVDRGERGEGGVPPSRFRRTKGRWMKYSSLIRCNCDVVLENSLPVFSALFFRTHIYAHAFFSLSLFSVKV